MSFFIKGKQSNGIKRAKFSNDKNKKKKFTNKRAKDEEITSSEEEEIEKEEIPDHTSSEDENETAQEKKLRLAKVYLEEIEREEKLRLESKEIDNDVISRRLKEDYLKDAGKLRLTVADTYKGADSENIKFLKCREQRDCITCVCLSAKDEFLYAGSKDGNLVKYSLVEHKKVGILPFTRKKNDKPTGNSTKVNAIAISSDSKYLVTSDESNSIHIWCPDTLTHIKSLLGHKKPVISLIFKKDSHQLYSGSKDRTIKVWSLDEMAYVETLFGHQDSITSLDALYRDRLVSSGGRDLRIWKITEETQLIFNGHNGNIDNVKLINEENFITGGDDGQICIWSLMRKKPLAILNQSHGLDSTNNQPNWVTAITSFLNTDLVATGSNNGFVNVYKLENNFKNVKLLFTIPMLGFVNTLNFTSDGTKLIVGVSKEYKLGRWNTEKTAKNGIYVVPLVKS
ncbi:unnamed protein product [Brassicogethes aeneus]|uniref:U3 small nucleolar RNA-interacting protein 2 n=1 Tax=Brassicogethes aeneus TaxID=1431903 RepID=A0A9P0FM39_BRAAE|nr:unnamed protein product [Brassicogethes aeneus]